MFLQQFDIIIISTISKDTQMGKKQNKAQQKLSTGSSLEIFISGLPYEATEDDIKGFFDFAQNPVVKLPKYQDTGRCLGYGHVVFETEEQVKQALAKDKKNIGSRYINVQVAKGAKQVPTDDKSKTIPIGCKVLFVKNLPYEVTKQLIRKQFETCGVIKEVRMIKNWQTKKFKGFAYIDFKDTGSVKKAITKYHGKTFMSRKLICDAVTTQMKKGFKRYDNEEQGNQNNKKEEENGNVVNQDQEQSNQDQISDS